MRRLLLAALLPLGCSSGPAGDPAAPPDLDAPDLAPVSPLVVARPYDVRVPPGYDGTKPTPLLVLLHGYGATGFLQEAYFGIDPIVDQLGWLFVAPDGTVDSMQHRFWNATDACCDFDHTGVDDVAYLTAVIDDVAAHYHVDPKRVYLAGHSNGGYMAHRMACDRADRIAAIVALAGDNWKDVSKCKPSAPVAVLQVHGDADTEVPYGGDLTSPSAMSSILSWVTLDGCRPAADGSSPNLDLDATVAGAETSILTWSGCRPGGAAELWTMDKVGHLPNFKQPDWPQDFTAWLAAHPKP